jgi:hypothetical protein
MKGSFEKQAMSEIPAAFARFLEISEDSVISKELGKDSGADLLIEAGKYTFLVESKSSSTLAQLNLAYMQLQNSKEAFRKDVIPLLVVPYMGETGRQFCDERRLSWIDLSGNAHIKALGLLIHIGGQPNRFKHAGRPPNIFAPKSSRIARQLLIKPNKRFTQRKLSRVTGLDEGHTSRIVRRLEENRLIRRDDNGSIIADDPDQLLDAWHEVYDFSKHQITKGHIAARSGDELLHKVTRSFAGHEIDYAATGLAAAWLNTHFANFRTATFYLRDLPAEKLFDSLNFLADERGANTWLVVPNDEGVFHGSFRREGISCVHPVQIYLDLKGHPERASEAASALRHEYLKWDRDA